MPRRPFSGVITQGYGNSSIYYGGYGITLNGGYWHNGWDFGSFCGSNVVAPESGTIYQQFEQGGYGLFIRFVGDSGWTHDLGHLRSYDPNMNGKHVDEGTVIAQSGMTGNATGCHGHWTTKRAGYNNRDGRLGASNPQEFLDTNPTPAASSGTGANEMYAGDTARDLHRAAIREIFLRVTGNSHSDADIDRNHGTKKLSTFEQEAFASQEYTDAVNKAYMDFYGRKATDSEIQQKRTARQGIPSLRNALGMTLVPYRPK